MQRFSVTLHFPRGYIADPYWPQLEQVISIQKASGYNRVRSEKGRADALKAYLDGQGMTRAEYDELVTLSKRPFYTNADGEIVIPTIQLDGCTAQAADRAPAAIRITNAEQVRTVVTWHDLATGRYKCDGTFDRFVIPKSGTGQPLSNQRTPRSSQYIADVTATGVLELHQDGKEAPEKARKFFMWAGEEIGVGASRKMGWGRFEVVEWTPAAR